MKRKNISFVSELGEGDDWRIFGQLIIIVNEDCEIRIIDTNDFLKSEEDWKAEQRQVN